MVEVAAVEVEAVVAAAVAVAGDVKPARSLHVTHRQQLMDFFMTRIF